MIISTFQIDDKLSRIFADLVVLSDPIQYGVFGEEYKVFLMEAFKKKKNIFSFQNTAFYVENNEIAGMILGFPLPPTFVEELHTAFLMIKRLGKFIIPNLPLFLKASKQLELKPSGEYYVNNLAVFEKFRRKGIAKKLLEYSENVASQKNCHVISLYVKEDNLPAFNLYKKLGYKETKKVFIDLGVKKTTIIRMKKNLF